MAELKLKPAKYLLKVQINKLTYVDFVLWMRQPFGIIFHCAVPMFQKICLELELLYLPAKTAPSLSPLDNGFFAQFKSKLYSHDLSDSIKKKTAAAEIYEDNLPETVQKYFLKCNLVHIQDYVEDDTDCCVLSKMFEYSVNIT